MPTGQRKTSKESPTKSKAATVDPELYEKATPPPLVECLFNHDDLTDESDNISWDFDLMDTMDLRDYQLPGSTPDK
jgi:hypothetical protein